MDVARRSSPQWDCSGDADAEFDSSSRFTRWLHDDNGTGPVRASVTVEQDGSGQFSTITAALEFLNGAPAEIHVGPGVYYEFAAPGVAVAIIQSGVHLVSTDGPDVTIIDGGGERCCVSVSEGSWSDLELNGFTIAAWSRRYWWGLKSRA